MSVRPKNQTAGVVFLNYRIQTMRIFFPKSAALIGYAKGQRSVVQT